MPLLCCASSIWNGWWLLHVKQNRCLFQLSYIYLNCILCKTWNDVATLTHFLISFYSQRMSHFYIFAQCVYLYYSPICSVLMMFFLIWIGSQQMLHTFFTSIRMLRGIIKLIQNKEEVKGKKVFNPVIPLKSVSLLFGFNGCDFGFFFFSKIQNNKMFERYLLK